MGRAPTSVVSLPDSPQCSLCTSKWADGCSARRSKMEASFHFLQLLQDAEGEDSWILGGNNTWWKKKHVGGGVPLPLGCVNPLHAVPPATWITWSLAKCRKCPLWGWHLTLLLHLLSVSQGHPRAQRWGKHCASILTSCSVSCWVPVTRCQVMSGHLGALQSLCPQKGNLRPVFLAPR